MLDPTSSLPARSVLNDCWNKIGVHGDGSCPELTRYTHCHNCPVYSAAAGIFLDRDLPQDHLDTWTHHFSQEKSVARQTPLSIVLFRLGVEWFGLPVTVFKEISELKPIHSIPHRQNHLVLGLINFRGELLICVSLSKMLGTENMAEVTPGAKQNAHAYLLIVSHGGHRSSFPVDEVGGIHHFNPREIKKVPATVANARKSYTTGVLEWRDHTVGCLDAELLFSVLGKGLS